MNLPVTVFANGIEIVVDSEEDLERIEETFDASDDDNDTLEIVFPITVTMSDYTEMVINNQAELNALRENHAE